MKSEYQKVKETVAEAVRRKASVNEQLNKEEAAARMQIESAQKDMDAALAAGSKEKYTAAGLAAEKAQLDLEFITKMRAANAAKPGAAPDDDAAVRRVLKAEEMQIRNDFFIQLNETIIDAIKVCSEAQRKLSEIDNIKEAWCGVMGTRHSSIKLENTWMQTSQFLNVMNARLEQLKIMTGGN
ncbi:MAG: hypothetical protein IJQ71_03405 [Clostridia bacterium]|nr:hypothetical protein [Clostridia bacterium]